MMRGLSTRNCGATVKDFHDAYGRYAWSSEIVALWRFTSHNGITEGLHNKMELINLQA